MFFKKIIIIFILSLIYQSPSYSKSTSLNNFNVNNFSKYFSGIVALENKNNSKALNFFDSSKNISNEHVPFLEKYIYSLIFENEVSKAINVIKKNNNRHHSFEIRLLLILDSLQKDAYDKANTLLYDLIEDADQDRINHAILETLRGYIHVFKEKKILQDKKSLGNLSIISETFQRCYLDDNKTDKSFYNLYNNIDGDYTRYIFFYLTYLIQNNKIDAAKKIGKEISYIDSTLLLSQSKNWLEENNFKKFTQFFSCKNPMDLIAEFLFLISNLYSTQDDYKKSNFYLSLSNFLNPKFIFNLSLVAENQFFDKEFNKLKKTLKNFKKDDKFYYWYRIKKQAQLIAKQKSDDTSLDYIKSEFNKIGKPNNKMLFDLANFYKNFKKYNESIKYYSQILENNNYSPEIKSDILYRRGASYERIGEYEKADKDFFASLKIDPDDAFVLNYLAYSWLERDYKIKEAIKMLEKAYSLESEDPYIIDSIGWAYYLVDDYLRAESFIREAVELMPDDPIVNDHYGDILWKLDRKIQARYFWKSVLKMKEVEEEMIKNINIKINEGLINHNG